MKSKLAVQILPITLSWIYNPVLLVHPLLVSSSFLFDHHSSHDSSSYRQRPQIRPQSFSSSTAMSLSKEDLSSVRIMVNGMPGPMATAAAEACLRKGLQLSPIAMTGPDVPSCTINVVDPVTQRSAKVRLIPSSNKPEMESAVEGLKVALNGLGDTTLDNTSIRPTDSMMTLQPPRNIHLLAVDYTHPSAVNGNALFYIQNDIPFVMGTTGGDRDQLMADMTSPDCSLSAVIAPNMGKQIVALQAGLADLAKKFPGAFDGYTLAVKESHQKSKADTSGTAKAVVDSIKTLAHIQDSTFTYDNIQMIRSDQESIEFGVSPHALKGHAFHTYTLTSPDQSVVFELKHNVQGRTIYADGTADAVKFLAKKLQEDKKKGTIQKGKVYNMIDVLEAGAME